MIKYIKNPAILGAIIAFGFTACSSKEDIKIEQLQKELDLKNQKISQLEAKNTQISSINEALVPQNAKPGECYAKVMVPAKYETKEIKKLVAEAQTNIQVVPATYKEVEKKVVVREGYTKTITIPATYKTISEQVIVEPEKTELISFPTTYKTVTEKVLIKPAHTMWKKGRGDTEKLDNATGEILCLVEVPAEYKTISSQVVDVPAHTKEVKIPATYKTVTKQVIDQPETTKEIKVPAICKIVKTQEIDIPVKEVKTEIPAVYTLVPTQVKVADSFLKWEPILCETNTTKELISKLQLTLREKKYNIEKITGIYDDKTRDAVKEYQKQNNLNQGALTIETLKSLGLQ